MFQVHESIDLVCVQVLSGVRGARGLLRSRGRRRRRGRQPLDRRDSERRVPESNLRDP